VVIPQGPRRGRRLPAYKQRVIRGVWGYFVVFFGGKARPGFRAVGTVCSGLALL